LVTKGKRRSNGGLPGPSLPAGGSVKVSGAVAEGGVEDVAELEDVEVMGAETVKMGGVTVVDLAGDEGKVAESPTNHVCSGVKLGGEQGALLRNPSAFRVKHWFPGPIPLFLASRMRGKPMPFDRSFVVLKKNC
jgi:hypothetical protein